MFLVDFFETERLKMNEIVKQQQHDMITIFTSKTAERNKDFFNML